MVSLRMSFLSFLLHFRTDGEDEIHSASNVFAHIDMKYLFSNCKYMFSRNLNFSRERLKSFVQHMCIIIYLLKKTPRVTLETMQYQLFSTKSQVVNLELCHNQEKILERGEFSLELVDPSGMQSRERERERQMKWRYSNAGERGAHMYEMLFYILRCSRRP